MFPQSPASSPSLGVVGIVGLIANLATAGGLIWAIVLFRREQQRLRREREIATHTVLNGRYVDYLKLCFENPTLHIHDFEPPPSPAYTDEQRRRRIVAFEMLVAVFELAYATYQGHTDEFRSTQWRGWERYVTDWCKRQDFLDAWDSHLGSQYDSRFMGYMRGEVANGRAFLTAARRRSTASNEQQTKGLNSPSQPLPKANAADSSSVGRPHNDR
jgi:hypothetical protein